MRELILKMTMSLDGFVSDLDGGNRWMFGADPEAKAWGVELVSSAGLHIMGSRSFQAMAPYWPTSGDPFAAPMNEIPKAVFSRRSREALWPGQAAAALAEAGPDNARSWAEAYVASGDLADEIAALKARNGKPIIAHGGVSFARSLVAQNLVDRFALTIAPVALGQGLPLFSGLATPRRLELVSARSFPGGAAGLIYRPA